MFILRSVRRGARALSLCGAIVLAALVWRSAPAAAAADGIEDFAAVFRGWCMDAPAGPAIAGNREAADEDVASDRTARCRRLAAVRARAFLAYAQGYRSEQAQQEEAHADAGRRLARWRESPLYRLADECRQMQAIGSSRGSSDGICLWGHEQLSASPFRFDRLPQKRLWEPEMIRRELSMVVARHPLGTDAEDMVADLKQAGFACRDMIESPWCLTSYGAVVYENFEVAWFGAVTWFVEYRASGSGALQNVKVSAMGVGP
jgi:hypothetical protein